MNAAILEEQRQIDANVTTLLGKRNFLGKILLMRWEESGSPRDGE
jgi:hypothetical protein